MSQVQIITKLHSILVLTSYSNTDFHLDEDYKEGSSDKELCHRGKGDAGVYGAVKTDCDSSPELVMQQIPDPFDHVSLMNNAWATLIRSA